MNDSSKPLLLIVDDDPVIRDSIKFVLQNDYDILTAESRSEVREQLDNPTRPIDLCLLDLGLPPRVHEPDEGFDLIGALLAASPNIKILVLSGQDDHRNVRHALALGAFDFVAKPCDMELLRGRLAHAQFIRLAEHSQEQPIVRAAYGIMGNSIVVENMRAQIEQFCATPFSVLIEGESGAGKELVCRGIHDASPRRKQPYLVLNLAAISSQLIEAQLFGFAKGAFTGASVARAGFFEEVGEGTLCLDEIGEMPLSLQAKLLRVLENGEFYRLGETNVRKSDARVIAATNRDLRTEVNERRFREDLYHRLSVFKIQVPPLRDRGTDREILADHFAAFYSAQLKSSPFRFDASAARAWLDYHFPGNVRELKNIVIRLCTRFPGQTVGLAQLLSEFEPPAPKARPPAEGLRAQPLPPAGDDHSYTELPSTRPPVPAVWTDIDPRTAAAKQLLEANGFNLDDELRLWEQKYIEAALDQTGGNLSKAAKLLGVNRTTLYSRMQKFSKPAE